MQTVLLSGSLESLKPRVTPQVTTVQLKMLLAVQQSACSCQICLDRLEAANTVTCGVVVGHSANLNADLHQAVKSLRLPVSHTHTHGLSSCSEPRPWTQTHPDTRFHNLHLFWTHKNRNEI